MTRGIRLPTRGLKPSRSGSRAVHHSPDSSGTATARRDSRGARQSASGIDSTWALDFGFLLHHIISSSVAGGDEVLDASTQRIRNTGRVVYWGANLSSLSTWSACITESHGSSLFAIRKSDGGAGGGSMQGLRR